MAELQEEVRRTSISLGESEAGRIELANRSVKLEGEVRRVTIVLYTVVYRNAFT